MATQGNRRAKITKILLQDAFIELLQHKPFSQITIKEICEKADLNRTTFYLHYIDRDSLIEDIESNARIRIDEYIRTIHAENDKEKYISLMLEYIRDNSTLFKILLFNNNNARNQKQFLKYITDTVNENSLAGLTVEQNKYAKEFITNGCLGILAAWFESDFDMSTKKLARQIYKMCSGSCEKVNN